MSENAEKLTKSEVIRRLGHLEMYGSEIGEDGIQFNQTLFDEEIYLLCPRLKQLVQTLLGTNVNVIISGSISFWIEKTGDE